MRFFFQKIKKEDNLSNKKRERKSKKQLKTLSIQNKNRERESNLSENKTKN